MLHVEKLKTYDLITRIENDSTYLNLLKRGIISLKILDYKVYYERYIAELKTHGKCQSVSNVAEEYKVSESTVRNAINLMNEC